MGGEKDKLRPKALNYNPVTVTIVERGETVSSAVNGSSCQISSVGFIQAHESLPRVGIIGHDATRIQCSPTVYLFWHIAGWQGLTGTGEGREHGENVGPPDVQTGLAKCICEFMKRSS